VKHRKFIRHPSDIPIDFTVTEDAGSSLQGQAQDVSVGGLAFEADRCPEPGTVITVRISAVTPPFETRGRVVWCRRLDGKYEIGVEFLETAAAFRARMVEQVCHIERYKQEVLEREGRRLNGGAAAREWIQKYAAEFPRPEGEAA
jgi:hypothetical protein